jgi:hypothetical protein
MTSNIESIKGEYLRFKGLGDAAIAQVAEPALCARASDTDNSIATICWHLSGNLESRFTDFLTSDGEKPWRRREEEFQERTATRAELVAKWNRGWDVLLKSLSDLSDADLQRNVTIRGQSVQVNEALHRSLGHVAYHVGQVVYLAKALQGRQWQYLTIPPGKSDEYNRSPGFEKPAAHAQRLAERIRQSEK